MWDQLGARRVVEPKAPTPAQLAAEQPREATGRFASPRVDAGVYAPKENPWGLTPAEATVIELLCEGLTAVEVCGRLDLAKTTVAIHTTKMRRKLQARTNTHACLLWDRHFRRS